MKAKIIIALTLAAPLIANSSSLFENLDLAKKSHQLSIQIKQIADAEGVPFCKEKVKDAASFTEMAAEDFMSDGITSAKTAIGLAIRSLGYTAVEDCQQANNILLARNEAKKIYDAAV